MPLTRSILIGGALIALCGSCDLGDILGTNSTGCTLIGCTSGLTVHLAAKPTGPIKIEVFYNGPSANAAAYVYDCLANCVQDVRFDGFVPDHPFVRITYGGVTKVTEVPNVAYTVSYPNGKKCGPECKQGTIDLPLPSALAGSSESL